MLEFLKQPINPLPSRLRCVRCGSEANLHYAGPGRYFCEHCLRRYPAVPEVPFDVVVDEWTAHLGALQAAGELVAVRLPRGFYGVCLLPGTSAVELAYGVVRQRSSAITGRPRRRLAHPGSPSKGSPRHP